ncbi:MAG: BolA/IbaG family iron-sulfur metabolism protein [Gallionellaceae bacterium]|nr:BolA/IbaG family iron-sulfur metabolism protein [Gallionellaceae bacterium]
MVTPESIEDNIRQGMSTTYLNVDGDGRHFEAVVVSEEFEGLNRIQRHQRVYKTLGERMRDEVHALSIKTFTPQEWNDRRKT